MMRSIKLGIVLSAMMVSVSPAHAKKPMTDEQIKRAIIQESIYSYFGNCPCPYNTQAMIAYPSGCKLLAVPFGCVFRALHESMLLKINGQSQATSTPP